MNNAPHRTKPTAHRWTLAVISLGGVAVVAACGSSGTGGSTSSSSASAPAAASGTHAMAPGSASASAIPCAQITALRSTLTDLSHTSVSLTSAVRIASDITKAEQELAALKSQGAGPFAAQAGQLSNALNAIKTDAAALAKSPSPTNVTNLTNAVNGFKTTAQPLIKEMEAACP
jgi:hypothetical protein